MKWINPASRARTGPVSLETEGGLQSGSKAPTKLLPIRESRIDDYPRIAAIYERNGLPSPTKEDWSSLWNDNPATRELKSDRPLGWVQETSNGEIVGSITSIPFIYYLGAQQLRVAAACSWVIDKAFRGYALALLHRFSCQTDVDLLITTTASPKSENNLKYLHWAPVPSGKWNRSYFWVTNHSEFAKCALAARSDVLARLPAWPIGLGMSLHDMMRSVHLRRTHRRSEIEECRGFDNRFDRFWEEKRAENSGVLLASRTKTDLAWHFRRSIAGQSLWILVSGSFDRVDAYAIFDRKDNMSSGLKRMWLVDFQALPGSESFLKDALAMALARCRKQGIHMLECTGCWLDRFDMDGIPPPRARTLPSWVFYYKTLNPALISELAVPRLWAPTSFDGDASL